MEHGGAIMGLLQKKLVLRLVLGWSRDDYDVNERGVGLREWGLREVWR